MHVPEPASDDTFPPSDAPLSRDPKTTFAKRCLFAWLVLCAVISFAGNLVLPKVVEGLPWSWKDPIASVLTGGLLAQFAALGTWMALSRWTSPFRILSVCTLGVLLPVALIGGMNWAYSKQNQDIPVAGFVVMILTGVSIPLIVAWLLSQLLRGRKAVLLCSETSPPREASSQNKQYGLKFLLAAMATTAVLTQTLRASFPKSEVSWLDSWEYVPLALWFLWLMVGLAVVAWLQCLIVLEPRRRGRMWMAWIACVTVGPLLFQAFSAYGIFGGSTSTHRFQFELSQGMLAFAYRIELGLILGLLLALLGAHWIGVRLESRDDQGRLTDDPPASSEPATVTPE
ncbi:MAG: hypothetical protein ACK5OB_06400 [Pirellula sp.]